MDVRVRVAAAQVADQLRQRVPREGTYQVGGSDGALGELAVDIDRGCRKEEEGHHWTVGPCPAEMDVGGFGADQAMGREGELESITVLVKLKLEAAGRDGGARCDDRRRRSRLLAARERGDSWPGVFRRQCGGGGSHAAHEQCESHPEDRT